MQSDVSVIATQIVDSLLQIQFLSSGISDVYINAIDQFGAIASDTINVISMFTF